MGKALFTDEAGLSHILQGLAVELQERHRWRPKGDQLLYMGKVNRLGFSSREKKITWNVRYCSFPYRSESV